MKIHEYQAKEILRQNKVPVPRGNVAFSAEEARACAEELGGRVVVKAQIHAGGRGKGGGVKLADNADQAAELASQILGMTLVTHQTGPEGRMVKRILVEETLPIERELYLGVVLDRAIGKPVLMVSASGGMDIEEVAAKTPELILKEVIEPGMGLSGFQARRLAYGMEVPAQAVGGVVQAMTALAETYWATDASLLEINPFVITTDGHAIALDAKMDFDDNALFRHPKLQEYRDLDEEEPLETDAHSHGLNYIKLDGNVGCMVNGAGLAMATMDIIQHAGGSPANFLDVGGGASAGPGQKRTADHPNRPQRQSHPDQRVWGNPASRHAGRGSCGRGPGAGNRAAHRSTAGRDQRRDRPQNPRGIRTEFHGRRRHEGCR